MSTSNSYQLNFMLMYMRDFGKHHVSAEAFAAGLKAAAGIAPVVTDDAATTGVTLHMAADATMKDEALRLGGFHLEPDRHRG